MSEAPLRSEEELEKLLKEAEARVPGGLYLHYKNGNQYLVTGYAMDRYSGEACVLYEAQYGKKLSFVRKLSEWFLAGDNGELRFKKL